MAAKKKATKKKAAKKKASVSKGEKEYRRTFKGEGDPAYKTDGKLPLISLSPVKIKEMDRRGARLNAAAKARIAMQKRERASEEEKAARRDANTRRRDAMRYEEEMKKKKKTGRNPFKAK